MWAVYPSFDIYLATDTGKILKKLTDAPGYDAEATINWKTRKMVYTSLASGDLDLWTMRADGSDKKQITKTTGYDGGATFSRDGKKLYYRDGKQFIEVAYTSGAEFRIVSRTPLFAE